MARCALLAPVVALVSLAAAPALRASARLGSPAAGAASTMGVEATQAVIDAYLLALVARENLAPFFSDDVVLELMDIGQRIQGRDEVAGAIVELHQQTFDAHPELTNRLVGEGSAAIEAVFVGTQTGEFAGIPSTGAQVAVPYAVFYDLADGQITALRIHGFASGLIAALTAEATPAAGTPTP
jgi:predicted ester cyclase